MAKRLQILTLGAAESDLPQEYTLPNVRLPNIALSDVERHRVWAVTEGALQVGSVDAAVEAAEKLSDADAVPVESMAWETRAGMECGAEARAECASVDGDA